jgi:ataxia telangiectasia mutated family protein
VFARLQLTPHKSAHARHRQPDTLTYAKAHDEIAKLKEQPNVDEKLRVYREVCKKFPPVFRHFFYEMFAHDAQTFVERRAAYTRSTAANSMVGMILGIGDRHLQNILLDRNTAEVVHIDFGVAFEQGKVLPVPEVVPYRLTRDICDGFGAGGLYGAYSRACEETLKVLREHQDAIMTILEVFMHDPLYSWCVWVGTGRGN